MFEHLLDQIRDKTGIYSLGFNRWSFLGIALPVGFVLVVGGIVSFMVMR